MNAQLIDGIARESVLAKMHALTLAARHAAPPPASGDFTFAQAMDDALRQVSAVQAQARASLQAFLADWLPLLYALRRPAGGRWSLEVDPQELY